MVNNSMSTTPKPIFWRQISPRMFALAPHFKTYMRSPGASGLKRWLHKTFFDPYTNLLPTRFLTTSYFGSQFEGTFSGVVQRRVFHFGIYEPNLTLWIEKRLQPGDVFIDVGANVGYFSLLASHYVGSTGSVVAIEPSPSTFAALEHHIEINSASNIRPVQMAAYHKEDELPMYYLPGEEYSGGASVLKEVGPVEAKVKAGRLCDILTDDELRRFRIMKIDVEGAEDLALQGLLPRFGDVQKDVEIIVEVLPTTKASVISRMLDVGMHAYQLENPSDPFNVSGPPGIATRIRNDAVAARSEEDDAVTYIAFSRRDEAFI